MEYGSTPKLMRGMGSKSSTSIKLVEHILVARKGCLDMEWKVFTRPTHF